MNLIDITAALLSNSGLFGDVLPAVAQDPAADLFFINIPVAGRRLRRRGLRARHGRLRAQHRQAGGGRRPGRTSVAAPFKAQGIPTYANENDALGTLAQLVSHTALMRKAIVPWPASAAPPLPPGAGRS